MCADRSEEEEEEVEAGRRHGGPSNSEGRCGGRLRASGPDAGLHRPRRHRLGPLPAAYRRIHGGGAERAGMGGRGDGERAGCGRSGAGGAGPGGGSPGGGRPD